ncbi:MAG: epimerase, partial [Chloroflexota bacterium]
SLYHRSKWEAHEQVARPMMDAGLPLVVVLPGAIYGLGDHSAIGDVISQFLRGRLQAIPKGSAYCWGHVVGTAAAHRLAMERGSPGEDYIIAGPPATLLEALSIVAEISGRRLPRLQIPASLLRGTSRALGVFGSIPAMADQAEFMRVAAGVTYLGDSAKAREKLGFAPRSLEDGFAEYIPALIDELGLA